MRVLGHHHHAAPAEHEGAGESEPNHHVVDAVDQLFGRLGFQESVGQGAQYEAQKDQSPDPGDRRQQVNGVSDAFETHEGVLYQKEWLATGKP